MTSSVDGDRAPGVTVRVLRGLVRGYQLVVSPWFPRTCKYYPSCSAYAITALERHGVVRGMGLAGWRLLRCNPWSEGGVDHVPAPRGRRDDRCAERGNVSSGEVSASRGPGSR